MKKQEAFILANELKNKHESLLRWKVTFNNRKGSFGLCSYSKREIQLSNMLIPFMSDKAIKDTILHEIAHALTAGHGHDYVWRIKFIELGGNGERIGSIDKFKNGKEDEIQFRKVTSKYTLTCPTCGRTSYANRMPKRDCSCSEHGRGYNPIHKMVITQNY